MPAGIPVGTLAIGKAGAINAGAYRSRRPGACQTRNWLNASMPGGRPAPTRWPNSRPTSHEHAATQAGLGQSGSSVAASLAGCWPWPQPGWATNRRSRARPNAPAAQVANTQIVADYDDPAALKQLADLCDVVTYEFENVPVEGRSMA
jgi:hypothetical protein